MRFVGQFTVGYGDYTAERDELFRDMTLADMVAGIKQRRGPATPQDPIPGVTPREQHDPFSDSWSGAP